MKIDLFDVNVARDLFSEKQSAYQEYRDTPNIRLFLFLVFSLNHLREWIAESSYKEVDKAKKSGAMLSESEKFFLDMWTLKEFRQVNELCNRSKHHLLTRGKTTSIIRGLHCGGLCTDSLGQTYYLVDGADSRTIFASLIQRYNLWFQNNG